MGIYANPVVLTLTSVNNGTYSFGNTGGTSDPDFPLISRAAGYTRKHDQGPSKKKINIGCNGWLYGNQHSDIVAKYQQLLGVLKDDDVSLYYYDGAEVVYNGRLYIVDYNEPSSWKQFSGQYSFSGFYYDLETPYSGGLAASFVSSDNTVPTYTFSPIPAWGRRLQKNVKAWQQARKTPFAGQPISNIWTVRLDGFLQASNYSSLQSAISALQTAFAFGQGTLNYGSFSNLVMVMNCDISPDYPANFADYTIELQYFDNNPVKAFSSRRTYPRVNDNPRIIDRPLCNARSIRFGMRSGQEVTYELSITSDTINNARSLLAAELAVCVVAGGIEMPGGTEVQDDDSNTVTVSIKQFYNNAILTNLYNNIF